MRCVVTTLGSFGDLHPYLAIALGLRDRGHEVTIATGECYRKKIEAVGLGFRPLRPDCNWVNDPAVMRRITHPRWGLERVVREVLLPALRETYEDLLATTADADLLVTMQGNLASPLVAEVRNMPWVSAMHLPIGLASAHDPPILPGFETVSRALPLLGPVFCAVVRDSLKWATRRWAKPWHRLRAELGLPLRSAVNPLTDGQAPLLHLALFSKQIIDKQPDWPPQTVVTGFPWYDQNGDVGLPSELAKFLNDGPPPIVFTLGTAIAEDAGAPAFFEQSAAAVRLLGHRAVLMTHDARNRPRALPDDIATFEYAPFSQLFPRTAAIVHHGGIGTTGLAMRSGRPMLVMPSAWDQPDNAARVARLGIARVIPRRRYTAPRVAAELQELLGDPQYVRRAAEVAGRVRAEDGVKSACDAIGEVMQGASSNDGQERSK
jgi:UDP:flavonoid glycosyltransferase YjiC (YdhE family)